MSSVIATPTQEKKILGFRVTTCELDFWTSSELWRIHYYRIIFISSFDFSFNKF